MKTITFPCVLFVELIEDDIAHRAWEFIGNHERTGFIKYIRADLFPDWISVHERLPDLTRPDYLNPGEDYECSTDVLVRTQEGYTYILRRRRNNHRYRKVELPNNDHTYERYSVEYWQDDRGFEHGVNSRITHWMPLPPDPARS